MIKSMIAGGLLIASSAAMAVTGSLGNPQPGSIQSGISTISGWVCDADEVTIVVDNKAPKIAAYGTSRKDTVEVCGHEYTGFGLLWSWSLFGPGEHRIRAYADGELFADRKFYVGTIGDGSFLRGKVGNTILHRFPNDSSEIMLTWTQANQNFSIVGSGPLGSLKLPDTGNYDSWNGVWDFEADHNYGASITTHYMFGREILMIVFVNFYTAQFEVYSAEVSGNSAIVVSAWSTVDFTGTATLVSPTRIRLDVHDCSPIANCLLQPGYSYYLINGEVGVEDPQTRSTLGVERLNKFEEIIKEKLSK